MSPRDINNPAIPRLSASRLDLASKCSGAFAHDHLQSTNEATERGTRIHEYVAALIHEEGCLLPPDHESATVCRALDQGVLLDAARPNVYSTLYTEIGLYLSPASDEAGVLQGDYHRDYSDAPEGSIPGTADMVAVEDVRVVVTDWKTGAGEVPNPADNY